MSAEPITDTAPDRYLTTDQVAELLGRARRTVDHWRYIARRDGDPSQSPPWITLNGRVLYPESELYAWIGEHGERDDIHDN